MARRICPHGNVRELRALGTAESYRNVEMIVQPAAKFAAPTPLDLVFTSHNYHDRQLKVFDPAVRGRTDQFALKSRKPLR